MGRKFDQIKINDPNDKLQYVVTPPSPASSVNSRSQPSLRPPVVSSSALLTSDIMEDTWSQQTAASSSVSTNDLSLLRQDNEVTVKRRVSRVESLRNLFFSSKSGHPVDARRKFLLKKRTRSEEKEKVTVFANYQKCTTFFCIVYSM